MNLADEYWLATNWALATLNELTMLKSSSNSRIKRQRNICEKMLHVCEEYEAQISEHALTHARVRKVFELKARTGCTLHDALREAYPR